MNPGKESEREFLESLVTGGADKSTEFLRAAGSRSPHGHTVTIADELAVELLLGINLTVIVRRSIIHHESEAFGDGGPVGSHEVQSLRDHRFVEPRRGECLGIAGEHLRGRHHRDAVDPEPPDRNSFTILRDAMESVSYTHLTLPTN